MIKGMDPLANEVIWEKLFKCSFWAQGNGGVIMAAIRASVFNEPASAFFRKNPSSLSIYTTRASGEQLLS